MSSERRDRSGAVSVRLKLPQPNPEIALSSGASSWLETQADRSQDPCRSSRKCRRWETANVRNVLHRISQLDFPDWLRVRYESSKIFRARLSDRPPCGLVLTRDGRSPDPSATLTRARSTPNGNPSRFTSTIHRPVAVPLEPGSIPAAVEPVGREGPGTIFRPTTSGDPACSRKVGSATVSDRA